jgi:hypothetical protein
MKPRLKAQIRLELFRYAANGDFPTYEDFYRRLAGKQMGQFPWQAHFDAIAKEERKLGYPDITFIVRRKGPKNRYPSQIDFRSAKPAPDDKQLKSLQEGTDGIVALYCPAGTKNPYRP